MTIEYIFLGMYFLFLLSLMMLANNVKYVAEHPVTERLINKIRYNLRDVPRVDYKELSDDESSPSDNEVSEEEFTLRNRRDTNPISRIIEEALN